NLILESIHCIDKETNQQTPNLKIKVEIENFHGIEINDFAVTVAKTALWIAELQMMQKTESIMERKITFFPLKTNAYIHEENALQIDWQDIIPKDKLHYIIGNPPFLGKTYMTKQQKQDQARLTKHKMLDYVACWYYKAAEYIQNTDIKVAFVSTSSITQGEQVGPLWTDIIEKYNLHIDFCHRSFPWDQESEETILYRERQLELATTRKQGAQKQGRQQKKEKTKQRVQKAQVHCVIIGFSQTKNNKDKIIYTYTQKPIENNLENNKKYETIVTKQIANNINPYLVDAPNIIIEKRVNPISNVPNMLLGNMLFDGGHFIINENEYEEFIKKEPKAINFIKKFLGAEEFLHNKIRYVLWLKYISSQELKSMPLVYERVKKVKQMRQNSISLSTQKLANTPTLYQSTTESSTNYIMLPRTSSERRIYLPIDYVDSSIVPSDATYIIPDAPLYHFALLMSLPHNAWMRIVAGRLKSDYRYSSNIVYNNFPFPELTETQKQKLNELGQNILDTRAKYPDSNLATLYDPVAMPPALLKAHQKLDKEVAKIYNKNWDLDNEAQIVSDLMQMYQQLLTTDNKDKQTTEIEDDEIDSEETTETEDDETTENTKLEYTDNTKTTETTEIDNTKTTETTEIDNKDIDNKESKKTKTRKTKKQTTEKNNTKTTETTEIDNTKTTETTEIDNKDIDNKESKKTKTRKTKKTEDKDTKDNEIKVKEDKDTKENKQTKTKTKRQTKKTDNNETETEIYASSPMTSKRTIKKVAKTKISINKISNKKIIKPKATIKTKKEIKINNEKIEKK
ncbi:MAG TPA: hypothetical protein P5543_10460, partial [Planctomycetota bacterium]|nr:hypothetical protein [Planctomycetota bacterium]